MKINQEKYDPQKIYWNLKRIRFQENANSKKRNWEKLWHTKKIVFDRTVPDSSDESSLEKSIINVASAKGVGRIFRLCSCIDPFVRDDRSANDREWHNRRQCCQ